MSSVYNIGVRIFGNASGYISAVNQTIMGTSRMSQGFRSATRDSGTMNNQMKALGTTIRYALAGQIVFGVTAALSRLQDFENELGAIDSMAGKIVNGKFQGLGGMLDDLGSQAIVTANKFGIATSDVETYMERFYSSFDQGTRSKRQMASLANQFASTIAGISVISGVDVGDPSTLAGGIAGFINSIPGGKNNISKELPNVANMVSYLLAETPSLTGQNIATGIGRIGSIMKIANMTPEEAMSVWGLAAKAGGSASIVTQGTAQLLGQALMNPRTPLQVGAFSSAGLSTNANVLRKQGGFSVLEKLLTHAATTGIDGQPNVQFLYNAFGRQQSVRQFVNLLSKDGPDALKKFLQGLKDAEAQNLYQQRVDATMHRRGISRLSVASGNLMLSGVRALDPELSFAGSAMSSVSSLAASHRATTDALVGTGVAYGLGRLLGKTGIFGAGTAIGGTKVGGVLGKLLGGRNVIGAAMGADIMAQEAPSILSGGAADGSKASPFWVVISPYSWYIGSPGGFSQPVGTKTEEQAAKNTAGSILKRLSGPIATGLAARSGLSSALRVGALAGGPLAIAAIADYGLGKQSSKTPPGFWQGRSGMWQGNQLFVGHGDTSSAIMKVMNGHLVGQGGERVVSVKGTAKTDITIKLVDKNGNAITVVEKKGVPIKITSDKAPTQQGKAGRGGGK